CSEPGDYALFPWRTVIGAGSLMLTVRRLSTFMRSITTALIIAASIVLGVLGVCTTFRHFGRKRAFGRMMPLECPAWRRAYGADILAPMKEAGYFWNPAPGHSVLSLRLPSSTFLVTWPHCAAETEFTPAGYFFDPPKEGVRSFTRIVRG